MASKTLLKSLDQTLIFGAKVTIASSFSEKKELAGISTTLRSKHPVTCNGKGRCAGDWCAGKAVFVVDPNVKPDETAGWRHGTAKVCLTHILDEDGIPVLPAPTAKRKTAPAPEPNGRITPPNDDEPVNRLPETPQPEVPKSGQTGVVWSDLAAAHQSGDVDLLAAYARNLKEENDRLSVLVIDAQTKLISALSK